MSYRSARCIVQFDVIETQSSVDEVHVRVSLKPGKSNLPSASMTCVFGLARFPHPCSNRPRGCGAENGDGLSLRVRLVNSPNFRIGDDEAAGGLGKLRLADGADDKRGQNEQTDQH